MTDDSEEKTPVRQRNGKMSESQRERLGLASIVEMLTGEARPDEQDYVDHLRRAEWPVALMRLVKAMHRLERRSDTGDREREAATAALLETPDRVKALEDKISASERAGWRVLLAFVTVLAGSAITVYTLIQASGEERGRMLERIDQLRANSHTHSPGWATPASSKDTSP